MSNQKTKEFKIVNSGTSTATGIATGGSITGTTVSTNFMYSTPELIDTIVTPDSIEMVYKRQLLIWNNVGALMPEVYKVVYSRFDGSEKVVNGNYVSPSPESYYFD